MTEIPTNSMTNTNQPLIPQNDPGVPPSIPGAVPEDKKTSGKFAALIRKEKMALQKLQAATAKEQAVAQREAALAAREARLAEFEGIREKEPIKALDMLGYSYNQLSEALLNDGKVSPDRQISRMQQEMEAFKQEQLKEKEESQKAREAEALAEQQEVLESFQKDIEGFVVQNVNDYPLINEYQRGNLVYASIDEHYTKTGNIVSIKEACDHVEKYLEADVEKALKYEKIRSKLLPPAPPKSDFVKEQWGIPQKPAAVRTLSNQMTPTAPVQSQRRLSEDEKIRRTVEKVFGGR